MRLTYLIWLLLCSVGPCVAADDGNLLANPGFEVAGSDALPQGWARQCYGTSQAYRDTSTVRTGEAGGRIVREPNDGGNVVALLIPRVPVRGGERYTLSGWGKGNVPAGQAKLFVYEYNEAGAWLGNSLQASVPAATDEWTPLIATETVSPECAWVQVRFEIYGGSSHGEASVDDVYLGDESSAPQAVRDLTAERQRDTAVLRWLPPDGAGISGYHVYATLDESFSPARAERVAFTTETEAEVPIPPGYGTYFAVVAVNQVGNSSRPEMAGPLKPESQRPLPAVLAWIADPDRRWSPVLPPGLQTSRTDPLPMVRGEYASLQILVGAPEEPLSDVSVTVSHLRGPGRARLKGRSVELLLQEYVELRGLRVKAPDPLPPAHPVDIGKRALRGWWLLLHTPVDATPGQYRGHVTVRAAGHRSRRLPLSVDVAPVTVPQGNHYGSSWGLWGKQVAEQEQVPEGSEEHRALMRRYADFLLEHRMVPRYLPGDIRSEETARWLDDERVSCFSVGTPAGWAKVMTDEQVAEFRGTCDYLRKQDWLDRAYIYQDDEPTPAGYEHCREVAR